MWGLLIPETITNFMASVANMVLKEDKEVSKEGVRKTTLSVLSGGVFIIMIPMIFNIFGLASSTVSTTAILGKKAGKSARQLGDD